MSVITSLIFCGLVIDTPSAKSSLKPTKSRQCSQAYIAPPLEVKVCTSEYTKKGSLYYSDDHTAYTMLNMIGKHKVVAHEREEYVREDIHINGTEGF